MSARVFEINDERRKIIESDQHLLVIGGPGSGKTTIALLKSHFEIETRGLKSGQKILFLSFARATVGRIFEQSVSILSGATQKSLEVNTYHGFTWNILRGHGYLLHRNKRLTLLPPPEAAAYLSRVESQQKEDEKERLFNEEGLIHFDLFARKCCKLFQSCPRLAKIFADAYPLIILDEFQDTNSEEWELIKTLGAYTRLLALADAEQRIYEFRGADPARIGHFLEQYRPLQFDFGSENNRSNGTDIVQYGNDLLTGDNVSKSYANVEVVKYRARSGKNQHIEAKIKVLECCKRLSDQNLKDWSIAILVPTKRLMLDVSDCLDAEQIFSNGRRIGSLSHDVALEIEGPSLAAQAIAQVLQCADSAEILFSKLVPALAMHIRGRKGSRGPSKAEVQIANLVDSFTYDGVVRGAKRKQLFDECKQITVQRLAYQCSGDPGTDWAGVRRLFESCASEWLRMIGEDARYLRLMHRGSSLRTSLNELWRKNGDYRGAVQAVNTALVEEHFATATKSWKGINVMTMHKSKGKEFDEVVIYEGVHQGRFLRSGASAKDTAQARLTLRVAVTRAKRRVSILTPAKKPSEFL